MSRGDRLRREWMLLKALEHPQGATLDELAAALPDDYPKHIRTIRRDLGAIESVFPIYPEKADGKTRWKLVDGAGAPGLSFSFTELLALSFCRGMLTPLDGTPLEESFKNATDKIRATLPDKVKGYVQAHERTISYGPGPHKEYERHQGTIDTLHRALDEQRTVRMRYASRSAGKTTVREVDPYNLRYAGGAFYLVAHCHTREEVRIFAVDRIKTIELQDRHYKVPGEFDIEQYMSPAFGVMRGDPVDIVLVLSQPTAMWVCERKWHPSQKVEWLDAGKARLTLHVPVTPELKSWILSLGSGARVLRPTSLKIEIFNEAMAIAEGARMQM